jgi:hypothetical protein
MTPDEYQHRLEVIARAMQLYGEAAQGNVNTALEMLNEPDFEISIPVERFQGLTGSPLDYMERPKCIDCGADCFLRQVPKNDEGVKSQVVCSACDLVLDSEFTIQEWLNILEKKES